MAGETTRESGEDRTRRWSILKAVSTTATSTVASPQTRSTLLGDYAALFKPRVSLMVVITAGTGFYLGSLASGIPPFHLGLLKALLGPMAQHRIGLAHGLALGFALVFGGSIYLAWATNPLTGTLTLLTAVAYVAIYTPLKRITTLNTFVGAFPGALPPLLGWTAARGLIEWPAVALFAMLFVWQFPHFMAIGWLYRADYRNAGLRVTATQLPVSEAARSSVVQALFYAVLMVPVSLWPYWLHMTGRPYAVAAVVLGAWYLFATVQFSKILREPEAAENRALARRLLKVSVMYLPLLMVALMLDAKGRLLF
jgi:protoheme IX farnesyltransferase